MIFTIIFGVLLGSCAAKSAKQTYLDSLELDFYGSNCVATPYGPSCVRQDCLPTPFGCIPYSDIMARQDCMKTPFGCLEPFVRYHVRQDSDLLATCEGNKDMLVSLGYTGDCQTLVSQLGSAKYQQIISSIQNVQDIDPMAACMEHQSELADLGYTGDCETLIEELGEVNIKEIMKNMGGAKNKGGPKDMKKRKARQGPPGGSDCLLHIVGLGFLC